MESFEVGFVLLGFFFYLPVKVLEFGLVVEI